MLDVAAVRAVLGGTRFADVHVVEQTGSTNEDVLPLLGREDPVPHTLVAEYQTHGRGRLGRSWEAAPGTSLLFTTTLPPIKASSLWAVPFWTALRIADGIEEVTEIAVGLQWPNDILLDGRKLAGILCISRINGDRAVAACGVGLNVIRPLAPLDLEEPAAFLADYVDILRERLLASILYRFDADFSQLDRPTDVARAWEERARIKDAPYKILRDGEAQPFIVEAQHLDDAGGLVVERNGTRETVQFGDARVLRRP